MGSRPLFMIGFSAFIIPHSIFYDISAIYYQFEKMYRRKNHKVNPLPLSDPAEAVDRSF